VMFVDEISMISHEWFGVFAKLASRGVSFFMCADLKQLLRVRARKVKVRNSHILIQLCRGVKAELKIYKRSDDRMFKAGQSILNRIEVKLQWIDEDDSYLEDVVHIALLINKVRQINRRIQLKVRRQIGKDKWTRI